MKLEDYPGSKPLWAQLYDILMKRIKDGDYVLDETLPTDKDLMEEFQVSRITVRNAMNKLISDGFIVRQRGVGSKVIKSEEDSLSTLLKLSYKGIYEDNKEKNKIIKRIEKVKPAAEVSEFFNIPKTKKILFLVREVRQNNEVIGVHETYLGPLLPLTDKDDFNGSLYEKLKELGFEINSVQEQVTSSIITKEEQELFGAEEIQAIMKRERKGFFDGKPIEYTRSTYLGKKYTLTIELGDS